MPDEHPHCTFPVYVFDAATGVLHVNTFGRRKEHLRARQLREIEEIIRGLRSDAEAGLLPPVKVGWPGDGRKPVNAADVTDEAVMASWNTRAVTLFVSALAVGARRAYVEARKERAS